MDLKRARKILIQAIMPPPPFWGVRMEISKKAKNGFVKKTITLTFQRPQPMPSLNSHLIKLATLVRWTFM